MLGYMYDTGRGVSKDDAEAAKYYRLAAEQGQATAQSNLGIFYKNGRGVAKSHVEAARWLRKAIDGGNKNALQQIQGLYDQHGYGIGKPEEGTFTLEDYLKSNSLTVTDVRGSKNGGFILTRAVSADKKEVDFSLWRYDESKQTFVRSWFSVRTAVNKLGISFDLSKDALTVLLHSQPDAHFLEVIKKNREKRIPVLWLNSTNRLTGTQTVFVALNSDGSEAALIRQSHVFWHVQVYSTSTGVPVRSQKVDYKNSPDKILYDHQNRYIAVQENVERHNTTTCYVFDTAKLETLKSWYGSECLDSSQDGTLLALRDKSGTKLIDTSGWNEIGQTNQAGGYGVAFGMDHKLVRIWNNAFEECILKDGKLMPIQRHYEDTQGAKAVYVAPANVWYAFRNGEIFKLKTATHEMKDAGVLTAEGVELLKAGFHEEGIRKLKQAVHRYPLTTLMNSTDFYVRLEEKNVPLKYIGDLLLSYVAEQLKAATEENKPGWGLKQEKESVRVSWVTAGSPAWRAGVRKGDAIVGFNGNPVKRMEDISFKTSAAGVEAGITVLRDSRRFDARLGTVKGVSDEELLLAALRRLTNYAMFAVQAGHPYLAKQAADRIRQIQKEYPADLYWEEKIKRAVALEAVSLAATQSPDQAYDHIMKLNGLIHDHEADISAIIVGYPGYWLPLYADRKKLAYILKMEESKLPTPKVVQRSVQPYPDLTGSLIEPVTAPPELRVPQQGTADEAQPVDTPPAKGRVLD
jgi:membrane-associated protease RseP (regulator of RpoE activity)